MVIRTTVCLVLKENPRYSYSHPNRLQDSRHARNSSCLQDGWQIYSSKIRIVPLTIRPCIDSCHTNTSHPVVSTMHKTFVQKALNRTHYLLMYREWMYTNHNQYSHMLKRHHHPFLPRMELWYSQTNLYGNILCLPIEEPCHL